MRTETRARRLSALIVFGFAAAANAGEAAALGGAGARDDATSSDRLRGLSFEAAAGVLSYTRGGAAPGPVWTLRAADRINDHFAVEGDYSGTVSALRAPVARADAADAPGANAPGQLVYSAFELDARLSMFPKTAPVQLFAFGGAGYVAYVAQGVGDAALIAPVGFGLEHLFGPVLVGARLTFRPAIVVDDLSSAKRAASVRGDTLSVTGSVGGLF